MKNAIFEKELVIHQTFKFLPVQSTKVKATLYDDDTIYFHSDIMKVHVRKGKSSLFTFTGKGAKNQRNLIDKSIDLFLEEIDKNKINHNLFK